MKTIKTPILFLIFNRPETTARVFEEIRKARPEKLFIAADGPRADHPEDQEKVRRTKEVVAHIDWTCDVQTLFQEKNLGCDVAVPSAIDWFFSHTEEGIILEDDCVPDQTFFSFCAQLLERYRDDARIMKIDGTNLAGSWPAKSSYFFSRYSPVCWGWATWKSSWTQYRDSLASLPKERLLLKKKIGSDYGWNVRKWIYEQIYSKKKTSWDYKWEYARVTHGGLSVIPSTNLVKYIGFGDDATHTKTRHSYASDCIPMHFPLISPKNTTPIEAYDTWVMKKIFKNRDLFFSLRKILLKILYWQ